MEDSIPDNKYQSVKFSDYRLLKGRVELRFFGGRDYEDRKTEFEEYLLRSMYGLKLACEPDEKRKEYQRTLWRFANHLLDDNYGLDFLTLQTYGHAYYALFEKYDVDFDLDMITAGKPFSVMLKEVFSSPSIQKVTQEEYFAKRLKNMDNRKSFLSKKGLKLAEEILKYSFGLD